MDDDERVELVRSLLEPQDLPAADSPMVRRYLRAVSGNAQQAARRLTATIRWRASQRPDLLRCNACAVDPTAHYMHVVGFDRSARPVIYSCNGMSVDKTAEASREHMLATFECAIKCMVTPGVEQWVWVMDFHGFTSADINIRLARSFLEISADHYPERLGLFLMVGAPRLFNVLWTAIEPFIDTKTRSKVIFLPYDIKAMPAAVPADTSSSNNNSSSSGAATSGGSFGRFKQRTGRLFSSSGSQTQQQLQQQAQGSRLRAELDVHFELDLVEWLLQEMAENRDPAVAAHKVPDPLRAQQQLQQLRQRHALQTGPCASQEPADQLVLGPSAPAPAKKAAEGAAGIPAVPLHAAAAGGSRGRSGASSPHGRALVRCESSKNSLSSSVSDDCRVCVDQGASAAVH